MVDKNIKLKEIKRLNSPLTFISYKAFDSEGNSLKCVENFSKVIFLNEPKVGILDDDEILRNAPRSKSAARIRLSRGYGSFSDKLLVNNSIFCILAFYYVILFSLMIPVFVDVNYLGRFICLILMIIPLFYLLYIFSLKKYDALKQVKNGEFKVKDSNNNSNKYSDNKNSNINGDADSNKKSDSVKVDITDFKDSSNIDHFKSYEMDVIKLKDSFDVKEENVRKLIEKRFKPPQITYDKFMANIDNAHKVFYNQFDDIIDIINLATYSDKVKIELENNIKSLELIIKQIDDLTNELLINNDSKENVEDIKNLVDDLEDLINSVKDY